VAGVQLQIDRENFLVPIARNPLKSPDSEK
jgi:hypothetical protein